MTAVCHPRFFHAYKKATEGYLRGFLLVSEGLSDRLAEARYSSHSKDQREVWSRMIRPRDMAGKQEHRKEGKGPAPKPGSSGAKNRKGTHVPVDPLGFLFSGRDERI